MRRRGAGRAEGHPEASDRSAGIGGAVLPPGAHNSRTRLGPARRPDQSCSRCNRPNTRSRSDQGSSQQENACTSGCASRSLCPWTRPALSVTGPLAMQQKRAPGRSRPHTQSGRHRIQSAEDTTGQWWCHQGTKSITPLPIMPSCWRRHGPLRRGLDFLSYAECESSTRAGQERAEKEAAAQVLDKPLSPRYVPLSCFPRDSSNPTPRGVCALCVTP